MTVGYFCLGALDLLGEVPTIPDEDRQAYIDWIYAQQIHPEVPGSASCGFRGGSYAGAPYSPDASLSANSGDSAHITMTYTALACLLILGDDLSRVKRDAIITSMKQLQQPNGSFIPYAGSDESDMRFLYCACATSYILNDWRGINRDLAVKYIVDSQTYEAAFGQAPGQEAHGGSTYCAIASLHLMGRLGELKSRDALVYWLLTRQEGGFNGRPNKASDTCYSFWVGSSLEMLGAYEFVDIKALRRFLDSTHSKHGGFGKEPGDYPDLLHSYLGLSGLAITQTTPSIRHLHTPTGLSEETLKHLQTVEAWSTRDGQIDKLTETFGQKMAINT
ncbi:terpenoid cyclases/protein prenyltransferase alpha-alpha toroid [Powellomyces hirtus]|nr:terpenoid cyclases/protein prenyltransferase alpha-alpha toroid [Powellomyces hirtus]